MKKQTLAGTILGASVVAIAVLSACTDTLRAGIDVPDEGPPRLTGIDASVAEASAEVAMCTSYECPAPFATCADKSGLCTTNVSNDNDHCGSCDVKCPGPSSRLRASFICSEAHCEMLCLDNGADCDHLIDNGCEVALESDPANCGQCGHACAPGQICWQGACGCAAGQDVCDGRCVNLTSDSNNCGACGYSCNSAPSEAITWQCGVNVVPPGGTIACVNSKCQTTCDTGRTDCNQDFCGDGCEIGIRDDAKNCGACNKACKDDQVCSNGNCLCDPGTTRCSFSCVDLQRDATNCGACGNVCPGSSSDHGSPVCDLGRCSYSCAIGYADCDGRLENGCEVDLTVDPRHCGSCDTQCDLAGGQPCAAGKCLTRPCDAGVVN
jgi:hypothetical protein